MDATDVGDVVAVMAMVIVAWGRGEKTDETAKDGEERKRDKETSPSDLSCFSVSSRSAMGKVSAMGPANAGQKPRVYKAAKGRARYKVFLGRKYLAYSRLRKDADKCVRDNLAAAQPGQCKGPSPSRDRFDILVPQ